MMVTRAPQAISLFLFVVFGYTILASSSLAASGQFRNFDLIVMNDNARAVAYPAPVRVSGLAGVISRMTVTVHGLNHTYPDDIDMLLVGPSGASIRLMSDTGEGLDLVNVTLTFDDSAGLALPDGQQIVSGSYRPTDFESVDSFLSPAPAAPYGSALNVFNAMNPNGIWSLFIVDDRSVNKGTITGGWSLAIETAESPTSVVIPSGGKATPYPSTILVSGMTGFVQKISVTLRDVSHLFPADLDILLVSPGGTAALLMSDVGSTFDLGSATIVFDEAATTSLPRISQIRSGSYKPTNYFQGDTFPAPAPARPYAETLSVFNATNPNGIWSLYVYDDTSLDGGAIGSWSLSIESALGPALNPINDQSVNEGAVRNIPLSASDASGNPIIFGAANLPAFATLTDNLDGTANLRLAPGFAAAGTYASITITAEAGTIVDREVIDVTVVQVNQPPIANAGLDQSVGDIDGNGSELVQLDGSLSVDPDLVPLLSYVWREGSVEIAAGIRPQVTLLQGVHTIQLRVTDIDGSVHNDTVDVTVADVVAPETIIDLTPPPFSGGYNSGPVQVRLRSTDNTGGSGVRDISYRASGAQTISPPVIVSDDVVVFTISSEGATTISFFATDNAGNARTAEQFVVNIDSTGPTANIASSTINPLQQIGTAGFVAGTVTWSGNDGSGSGLKRFELELSIDGGAFAPVGITPPLKTTLTRNFNFGSTYAYRVRAVDIAGNVGGFSAPRQFVVRSYQENAPQIAYSSGWTGPVALAGAWGGSVKHASTVGTEATFTFDGTSVAFVSRLGPDRGNVRIFIDGVAKGVVDLYASSVGYQRLVFVSNGLPDDPHTMTVRALGTKNALSSGTRVDLDGFVTFE